MMKQKILGVASTSYHLLVFLFLKDAFFKDVQVDLVVTNKSPYLYDVYKSGRLEKYFHQTFYADARRIKNPYKPALVTLWESFVYNPDAEAIFDAGSCPDFASYDDLYFASPGMPDEIVKEMIKTMIHKNHKICLHRFEDGFASYTKPPVSAISTALGQKLYQILFRYPIGERENELYLFEPSLAEENVADTAATGFSLKQIPKTQERIRLVTEQIQDILQFESKAFSEKYMFLGQGTANGMRSAVSYRSLVYDIAGAVGYDNFIVKPHPRGEHDKFGEQIHLYNDTCPFELAVANGTMEDKVLISYYSTACVSGKLLFDSRSKIIFLYPLAGDSFNEKCDYENYFSKLCALCDNVHVARTRQELFELLG